MRKKREVEPAGFRKCRIKAVGWSTSSRLAKPILFRRLRNSCLTFVAMDNKLMYVMAVKYDGVVWLPAEPFSGGELVYLGNGSLWAGGCIRHLNPKANPAARPSDDTLSDTRRGPGCMRLIVQMEPKQSIHAPKPPNHSAICCEGWTSLSFNVCTFRLTNRPTSHSGVKRRYRRASNKVMRLGDAQRALCSARYFVVATTLNR